jgi:carbonic anhydrase
MNIIKRPHLDPEKQFSTTRPPLSNSEPAKSGFLSSRMSRRKLLETGAALAGGMVLAGALDAAAGPPPSAPPPWAGPPPPYPAQNDPAAALAYLLYGNQRYAYDKARNPGRDQSRRSQTVGGQAPFAVILSCADSRVPVEVLFDVGIGDVFVIRVAGNTAGVPPNNLNVTPVLNSSNPNPNVGSISYALQALGTRLVMVLGHQNCGACAAALEQVQNVPASFEEYFEKINQDSATQFNSYIQSFINPILPPASLAASQSWPGPNEMLEAAIQYNVAEQVALLKSLLGEIGPAEPFDIQVVGYEYSLATGLVTAVPTT